MSFNNRSHEEEKEPITATIRGLDPELYSWAMARAKETGQNIGDTINQAIANLRDTAQFPEDVVDIARESGTLRLSKEYLSTLGKRVRIFGVGKVAFDETVQAEDLTMIHIIEGCGMVIIPEKIYGHVMEKVARCGRIRTYQGNFPGFPRDMDPRIGGIEELELSQTDLEQLDDGTIIDALGKLSFREDIKTEAFEQKIGQIKGRGTTIEAPPHLRVPILKRASNIGRISETH